MLSAAPVPIVLAAVAGGLASVLLGDAAKGLFKRRLSTQRTEQRLAELGIELPVMPKPLAIYVPCTRAGNTLFLSGHVPFKPDMKNLHVGKVGVDFTTEQAADLARLIGLELISTLKANVGELDRVKKIVKLVGFVNCKDDYTQQPEVINGCSNLFVEVWACRARPHT